MKNKVEIKNLEELQDLQLKVLQVRLVEKLGKQAYHYDIKELFEATTKTLTDTNQKLIKETKFNTKASENLDQSIRHNKTWESMNKNEVIHSSLIRPVANFLVPKNKSHFRLLDDPDSDKWNDYKRNGEKNT